MCLLVIFECKKRTISHAFNTNTTRKPYEMAVFFFVFWVSWCIHMRSFSSSSRYYALDRRFLPHFSGKLHLPPSPSPFLLPSNSHEIGLWREREKNLATFVEGGASWPEVRDSTKTELIVTKKYCKRIAIPHEINLGESKIVKSRHWPRSERNKVEGKGLPFSLFFFQRPSPNSVSLSMAGFLGGGGWFSTR